MMSPKWLVIPGGQGKGVNTVVIAGRVIRKNILGNIEFGFISDPLMFPPKNLRPVPIAWNGTGNYDVSKIPEQHPYVDNFGDFKGFYRADNLAAFGVGHGIAHDLSESATWKALQGKLAQGLSPSETADLVKEVKKIIVGLLRSDEALDRRVNKYREILVDELTNVRTKMNDPVIGIKGSFEAKYSLPGNLQDVRINPNAMFFIAEYKGFNLGVFTRICG